MEKHLQSANHILLVITFYDMALMVFIYLTIYSEDGEEASRWNNFVESIKSKLTVKQVVDGVRAGGSLSFDYLLLIVTAEWVQIHLQIHLQKQIQM